MSRRLARTAAVACAAILTIAACGADHAQDDVELRSRADDAGAQQADAAVEPASADASACERRDPTLEASADSDEPVSPGTSVTYTMSITNHNGAGCAAESFRVSATTPSGEQGFRADPAAGELPPLASGETAAFTMALSSSPDEESGAYEFEFFVRSRAEDASSTAAVLSARAYATYVVAAPEGCHVAPSRELLIRHPSVVDDEARTEEGGAWTFGRLMEQLSPDPESAPELAEAFFSSFKSTQIVNGFEVGPRAGMDASVLAPWPRLADGKLDLSRAPMRLLAIANRLDLADSEKGKAGEGRLVFGLIKNDGRSLLFTIIFEYLLPAKDAAEQRDWAMAVHALQNVEFPSEAYNRALQDFTERFTARGALPSGPNGSALLRVRTNENALAFGWEMREFHLSAETGYLVPAPLEQTPHASFNGSESLARFIESNHASILLEKHEVPSMFDDTAFQAGALINNLGHWDAQGITDPEVRREFSLNTCDGCHGGETASSFFHIFPRMPGTQSELSGFLTGGAIREPSSGAQRTYDELSRRQQLLESIVCTDR